MYVYFRDKELYKLFVARSITPYFSIPKKTEKKDRFFLLKLDNDKK